MKKRFDEFTGESLFCKKHESGLSIYIMPRKGYNSSYAIFGTRYGSVDSCFKVPGEDDLTTVPDGIAHYLEHKMFDQPDGSNVFDKFSKFGGNANAFTSFNMTAYLFSCTDCFYDNLKTLMDYVQSPYFTKESVQKEQGIIGQEIKMYDDNAPWRVFFNLLGCLYHNHPVKLDIAGTVDSISHIDADLLYKCYNTFYNLSNMAIFVTGDLDVEETLSVIEGSIKNNKPFTEEIERVYPDEPDTIASSYCEQKIPVAQPIFMIGFKDTDVGYGGERLLKKSIEMDILSEMMFGKSTKLYNNLYSQGLINNSFSVEFNPQIAYGFTAIEGESPDPQKVFEEIKAEISSFIPQKEEFERIKKVVWGDYIRSFNDIEGYAHSFITELFTDGDYFDYPRVFETVSFEDIKNRFKQHFDTKNAALSVVKPIEN
ncbi:MAG: insulinase family protein [Eubacteriales bacterium]|nr:insulinase family protein [Eubacteriales bacterium]